MLLDASPPLQLAGLLYLGAAAGTLPLALRDRARRGARRPVDALNRRRLWDSIVLGGAIGPVLVLFALQRSGSGSVALQLNLEMAATAVLGVLPGLTAALIDAYSPAQATVWKGSVAGLFTLGLGVALEHVHSHRHDDGHHDHEHPGLDRSVRHAHRHLPDLHHRHRHGAQEESSSRQQSRGA